MKSDNEDLQHEFQSEREGYLSVIREQEKRLLLYRTMLDKMSQVMQRNCNYSNLDKIIEQARYDEENNQYCLPEPIREEVQFPQMGNVSAQTNGHGRAPQNTARPNVTTPPTDYEPDFVMPSSMTNSFQNPYPMMNSDEIETRYGRNLNPINIPGEKILSRRQEKLLSENSALSRAKRPLQMNNNENDYMNRRLNPFEPPSRLTRK